jgi:carboxylate-amine ligase
MPSPAARAGSDHDRTGARSWSRWQPSPAFSIGLEEEVMLLDPGSWRPAHRSDEVLSALEGGLAAHASGETHLCALELATGPHATVGAAIAELGALRARLARALRPLALRAAVSGTHPTAVWRETLVSPSERYRLIDDTMRDLARREPTFALHVHVGVADPEDAIRLLNRLRAHLPLLLALSANSPFWQGRDTRLCSMRIPLFDAFPRTGIPRRFLDYGDWRATVDLLIGAQAIPEPTFLWWDVRPQPRLGTVEVRIMDAQTSLPESAALCALVQSLARLELDDGRVPDAAVDAHDVLLENRFLAARDGVHAALIDIPTLSRRPVAELLDALMSALRPHALALGCEPELSGLPELARSPGAARQRALAAAGGIDAVARGLAALFAPASGD